MPQSSAATLCLIVPCFNEADSLPAFLARCESAAATLSAWDFTYCFVDDGSTDDTWSLIRQLADANPRITGLRLARNYGHQRAITAGLDTAQGDAFAILDADLQDPPELLVEMLATLDAGSDLVHAIRTDRASDSPLKRASAWLFYRVVKRWVLPELPENAGDFKVFNRRVLEAVRQYREHVRFLRGTFATAGFRQSAVCYTRPARHAGHSKYPLRSMLRLARDAVFSNSALPLRWCFYTGAFLLALWLPVMGLALALAGFSLVLLAFASQWIFSSLLLMGIGLAGEYFKVLMLEVKDRPLYLISDSINAAP